MAKKKVARKRRQPIPSRKNPDLPPGTRTVSLPEIKKITRDVPATPYAPETIEALKRAASEFTSPPVPEPPATVAQVRKKPEIPERWRGRTLMQIARDMEDRADRKRLLKLMEAAVAHPDSNVRALLVRGIEQAKPPQARESHPQPAKESESVRGGRPSTVSLAAWEDHMKRHPDPALSSAQRRRILSRELGREVTIDTVKRLRGGKRRK